MPSYRDDEDLKSSHSEEDGMINIQHHQNIAIEQVDFDQEKVENNKDARGGVDELNLPPDKNKEIERSRTASEQQGIKSPLAIT